jgi:hypothetical protein
MTKTVIPVKHLDRVVFDTPTAFDVALLRVQPGDLVIIRTPGAISDDLASALKAVFERTFSDRQIRTVILADGMSVEGLIRETPLGDLLVAEGDDAGASL